MPLLPPTCVPGGNPPSFLPSEFTEAPGAGLTKSSLTWAFLGTGQSMVYEVHVSRQADSPSWTWHAWGQLSLLRMSPHTPPGIKQPTQKFLLTDSKLKCPLQYSLYFPREGKERYRNKLKVETNSNHSYFCGPAVCGEKKTTAKKPSLSANQTWQVEEHSKNNAQNKSQRPASLKDFRKENTVKLKTVNWYLRKKHNKQPGNVFRTVSIKVPQGLMCPLTPSP